MSFGAGFMSYGLTGSIIIDGIVLGFEVRATVGFAIFAIVFFSDPPAEFRSEKGTSTRRSATPGCRGFRNHSIRSVGDRKLFGVRSK